MTLTERKKADRAKMAAKVVALVKDCGASAYLEAEGTNSIAPRRVVVNSVAAHGFEALCTTLRKRLASAADGSAFDMEAEAAYVAENGTAAQRNAQWDAYFAEFNGYARPADHLAPEGVLQ